MINTQYNTNLIRLNTNKDINFERNIWNMFIINKLIFLPIIFSLCRYTRINIKNNNTLSNPCIARCNNNKCRRIYYLREKTFFLLFPKINITTILYIMKIWLLEKKNTNDIYNHIKNETENIVTSKLKKKKFFQN